MKGTVAEEVRGTLSGTTFVSSPFHAEALTPLGVEGADAVGVGGLSVRDIGARGVRLFLLSGVCVPGVESPLRL